MDFEKDLLEQMDMYGMTEEKEYVKALIVFKDAIIARSSKAFEKILNGDDQELKDELLEFMSYFGFEIEPVEVSHDA